MRIVVGKGKQQRLDRFRRSVTVTRQVRLLGRSQKENEDPVVADDPSSEQALLRARCVKGAHIDLLTRSARRRSL
jgi:hypothetical protein